MTTIRWGILGTGYVAQQFAQGLRFVPDATLHAIASRTETKAKTFAQRFQVPNAYMSYEELVKNPDIDVVYIATPPAIHKDNCLLCLNAGKAVLCEKPFTVNSQEAQTVIDLAKEKELFCMEAMWTRFLPLVQKARDWLIAGKIGEVRLINSEFGVPVAPNSNLRNPNVGGGALLDRGIYGLSLISFLLGEPDHIVSQLNVGASGVDEQAAVILKYDRGAIATISASFNTYSSNEMVIMGTHGTICLNEPFCFPCQLSISTHTPPDAIEENQTSQTMTAPSLKQKLIGLLKQNKLFKTTLLMLKPYLTPLIKENRITDVGVGNGYNYEAEAVVRCLQNGQTESSMMPLDETLSLMKIMDHIRE
ncbi:MAG: Gfo/Idh/MocA family oxidoreductase [Leptolyngbyaceae cyanobacterium]